MGDQPSRLLTLKDWPVEAVQSVLDAAGVLKQTAVKQQLTYLAGRQIGLLFEMPSTRTQISFLSGIGQLGAAAHVLQPESLQIKRSEPLKDTARVLNHYLDALIIRTADHHRLETWGQWLTVPLINGLSDRFHPCQILADLLTLRERRGDLGGLELAYIGDGNNVCHSLVLGGAPLGVRFRIASPRGYEPDPSIVSEARRRSPHGDGGIRLSDSPREAVEAADAVYTDVWASMGQEAETEERRQVFNRFQINEGLMARAELDAVFMHCLPAHRGEEVTDTVLEGPRSVVFEQAENRLHVQKALLLALLEPQILNSL